MSKIINFKARFYRDLLNWRAKHPEIDDDKADRQYDVIYKAWCERPKKWLNGQSPNEYFAHSSPMELVSFLEKNVVLGYEIPEPLLDSIIERKEQTYPLLLSLIELESVSVGQDDDLRDIQNEIVKLIHQMDEPHPYRRYISLLLDTKSEDALADELCARISECPLVEAIVEAYECAFGYAKRCFIEIISKVSDPVTAFEITLNEFRNARCDYEFFAQCFARIGDERAIPYLEGALDYPEVDYYTYIDIKNALETLGADIDKEREFAAPQNGEVEEESQEIF